MRFPTRADAAEFWRFVADAWPVVWLCRFSVFSVLLGLAVLVGVDQAREALMRMVQGALGDRFWSQAYLCAFVSLWAFGGWYGARTLLRMRFPQTPARTVRLEFWARVIPRLAGAGAYLAVATGFGYAWYAAKAVEGGVRLALAASVITYVALALVFLVIVSRRSRGAQPGKPDMALAFRQGDNEFASEEGYFATRAGLSRIPWRARVGIGIWMVLTVFYFLLFSWFPLGLPMHIGAVAIFALAVAAWIPFGSLLVGLSDRFRVPLFVLLALAAVALSYTRANDNHLVRMLAGTQSLVDGRPQVRNYLGTWIRERRDEIMASEAYPVVFVAAAGGGARAAYWTAGALGDMHDACPRVARHVAAASGVSGGSLGLLLYLKTAGPTAPAATAPGCAALPGKQNGNPGAARARARAVLGEDFIAPTLATMLFPDLTHQLTLIGSWLGFAFPAHFTDRGVTLERAWEQACAKDPTGAGLEQGLLASLPAGVHPMVLLNGTAVETGKRLVTSNIRVTPRFFADAVDILQVTNADVPLSTAAHLSARFTYVSPPGVIVNAKGERWGHVVDGGYFENSGASEILAVMRAFLDCFDDPRPCGLRDEDARSLRERILPILLYLPNDPERLHARADVSVVPPPRYELGLNDLLSPLDALLNAREARANYAEKNAEQFVTRRMDGAYIEIGTYVDSRQGVELPLGWTLSPMVFNAMDEQIVARRVLTAGVVDCVRSRSRESCARYRPYTD